MTEHKPYPVDENLAYMLGQLRDILAFVVGNYTANKMTHGELATVLAGDFYTKWNAAATLLNQINIQEDTGVSTGYHGESPAPRGADGASGSSDDTNDSGVLPGDDGGTEAVQDADHEAEATEGLKL